MSAFYLGICFTAILLDHMIKAIPLIAIDNLEQLSKIHYMKIYVRDDNSLATYAQNVDTNLAKAIKSQLQTYKFYDFFKLIDEIRIGLRNNSAAWASTKITIIFYITRMMKLEKPGQFNERLIDLLHISEDNGGMEPYFLFQNGLGHDWVSTSLNQL